MKKILIFNILALCLALHSKAQNYGYDDTYAEQSADLSSTEGFQMEAEPASAGGDAEPAALRGW